MLGATRTPDRLMAQKLVLYSTNSLLAYRINQRFYGGQHYVFCSPHFSGSSLLPRDATNPVTTLPASIYKRYKEEVDSADRHAPTIGLNKMGVRKGAAARRSQGIISREQEVEINAILAAAETSDFMPLIYIVPYELVKAILHPVPVARRAHPLSEEYVIEHLPRELFDVIELD